MTSLVSALLDGVPLPALFVGRSLRIEAINAPAESILGQGLTGRHYITALRQPSVLEAIEATLISGTPKSARYQGRVGAKDASYEMHCAPITDAAQPGVLITLTDVTSREAIVQMRRDFVANVSHELRTPLTAVMGFIETLQGPAKDDPAAQARFLDIMAQETARMNRLVGDLLSLNRVENEARQRPRDRVLLADVLSSVVHTLGPLAQERGATLDVHVDPQAADVTVLADADQLRQVFTNLIENAIKYGGEAVAVTIAAQEPAPDARLRAVSCAVRITDTGPGFDPIHIPRLTERFYRIDGHRSREMGGTGLGLAIVKHILSRHRGRLDIRSTPGQGSEFTVILPMS